MITLTNVGVSEEGAHGMPPANAGGMQKKKAHFLSLRKFW